MNSALFVGKVNHRRKAPFEHRLRYRTYSLLVDLDELDGLTKRLRLLSRNRWNLFSVHDRDHGARDGSAMRAWFDQQLGRAGIDLGDGKVEVLLYPRLLGYTFNPLTVWFGRDASGKLRAVLYEIHNTFGHSRSHLVPIEDDVPHRHGFDKDLHVSPFFDREGSYSFTLRPPQSRFSVSIDYATADEDLLTATMVGERRKLSDRNLARVFLTHPLLTVKIIGGIHWQALRLLLKGARYRSVPAPPDTTVSVEGNLVST
jgi:DUF1365 family protein